MGKPYRYFRLKFLNPANYKSRCSEAPELFNGSHLLPTPEPTDICYEIGVGPIKDCKLQDTDDDLPKPIPICDENTPARQICIDEGDFTDCEDGFRDYGFGCELVKKEISPL